MIAVKKCKGQAKAVGYLGCSMPVDVKYRKFGLCPDCYRKWLLSTKEGAALIERVSIKAKKDVEKSSKKKSREKKLEEIDYSAKLQSKVQEIARLIDIGLPCLARGYHANQIHGGHIFSRGSERFMRLNLHNIHRQSSQSNTSGNDDGLLREQLELEYGSEYMEFLKYGRRSPPLKFSNAEYRDLYKTACGVAKELRRQGRTFSLSERIEMRNKVNTLLGVYSAEFACFVKKDEK